jgi:hypothetical protein
MISWMADANDRRSATLENMIGILEGRLSALEEAFIARKSTYAKEEGDGGLVVPFIIVFLVPV